jgi:hypothetical protein
MKILSPYGYCKATRLKKVDTMCREDEFQTNAASTIFTEYCPERFLSLRNRQATTINLPG